MGILDLLVFVSFVASVICIGLWKSSACPSKTHDLDAQDYFLAGRGLTWWLVGFSLIAANISTEQFVGMSGKAADWLGIAIASYEWMAAVTLVVVAFVFLPKFLRSGIYTIPEFLEYRYSASARTVMAICTLMILVGVPTASVIYSGAKVICVFFRDQTVLGLDLGNVTVGCWIIGVFAAVYVFAGGLKACAWADLLQGAALIIAGGVLAYLAINALEIASPVDLAQSARDPSISPTTLESQGGVQRFLTLNSAPLPQGKLHMVRSLKDKEMPWSVLLAGLWVPNLFYWGLNQYITQRTLGARSLAEGQKGIIFAAFLKLAIPFIVVVPGILAYNLYQHEIEGDFDSAFPTLLRNLLPQGTGLRGFVLAAIFGAVVSSLASMLNSASTIFSLDIYHKVKGNASQRELVTAGRVCTIAFVIIALLIAPQLGNEVFGGIFTFIQEFQGFISPGILAIFLFALLVPRAPRSVGIVGLLLNPLLYGLFKFSPSLFGAANPAVLAQLAEWSFLDRMALCFGIIVVVLTMITLLKPAASPIEMPVNEEFDLTSSPSAKLGGVIVMLLTVALYWYFW